MEFRIESTCFGYDFSSQSFDWIFHFSYYLRMTFQTSCF